MTEPTPAIYTGTLGDRELLLTVYDDGTPEIAHRPVGSDPWRRWSPPIRLTREAASDLPAAATRTAGLCPCGQSGCSDAGVRA
jgi:hypothetical protein